MSIARLLHKNVLLPDGWAIARIIRANARRFVRITALKSKQNRTEPIVDRSERSHDITRLLYVFPKLRVLARGQSRIKHPRGINDAEIMPDTKQRSNYDR